MGRGYGFIKTAFIGAGLLAITSFSDLYAQGCNKREGPKARIESKEKAKEEEPYVCYLPRFAPGPKQNFEPKRKVEEDKSPIYYFKQYEPKLKEEMPKRSGDLKAKPKMIEMQEFMRNYAPKFAPGSRAEFGPDFGIYHTPLMPRFGMMPGMQGMMNRGKEMMDKMKERFGKEPPQYYHGYRHERPNKSQERPEK